jgi:hypothetical protein
MRRRRRPPRRADWDGRHPGARQLELLLRGQAVLLQQHALHGEQRVRDRQRHRQRQLVCAPAHSEELHLCAKLA